MPRQSHTHVTLPNRASKETHRPAYFSVVLVFRIVPFRIPCAVLSSVPPPNSRLPLQPSPNKAGRWMQSRVGSGWAATRTDRGREEWNAGASPVALLWDCDTAGIGQQRHLAQWHRPAASPSTISRRYTGFGADRLAKTTCDTTVRPGLRLSPACATPTTRWMDGGWVDGLRWWW